MVPPLAQKGDGGDEIDLTAERDKPHESGRPRRRRFLANSVRAQQFHDEMRSQGHPSPVQNRNTFRD